VARNRSTSSDTPSADWSSVGSIFAAFSSAGFIGAFPYFGNGSYISADVSRLYCGSFGRPWTGEELGAMSADQPMTAEQAVTLKRLAEAAYELDAFKPNLTRAEADVRIAMLTAKLKLLDEPPHTL